MAQRRSGRGGNISAREVAEEDLRTFETLLEHYAAARRINLQRIEKLESQILHLRDDYDRAPADVEKYREKVKSQKLVIRNIGRPVGKPILSKRDRLMKKARALAIKLAELNAEIEADK